MGIEQTMKRGRRNAEKIMTDTVVVTRRSDTPVTDPETSKVTYPTETIYDGHGRIQARNTEGTHYTDAGAPVMLVSFRAQVPADVDLQRDDQIEITASESDGLMVGRSFRVDSVLRKTHSTKTIANVEEAA